MMSDSSCDGNVSIQGCLFLNDKHSLADAESLVLYGADYDKFVQSRALIEDVYRFEELFSIVVSSALEFEQTDAEIANRARHLITIAHASCLDDIQINHRLFGFLTALGAYREAVRLRFGEACRFELNSREHGRLEQCRCIRNYMVHAAVLPLRASAAFTLSPTDDVIVTAQRSFKIDELRLDSLNPNTQRDFVEYFGANEQVFVATLVSEGLCSAVALQARVRLQLEGNGAFDRAKENQLAYDKELKDKGLNMCFKLTDDPSQKELVRCIGLSIPFPFTQAATLKAIDFLKNRYKYMSARQQVYVTDVPNDSVKGILESARESGKYPQEKITPFEVGDYISEINRQAWGS